MHTPASDTPPPCSSNASLCRCLCHLCCLHPRHLGPATSASATSDVLPLLPLPLVGIYIWSTHSGHRFTIWQYCFCSQLQRTWWKQIKKEMVVEGEVTQRRECLRKKWNQLNNDRHTEWGYRLHTGIHEKITSMEDMNWSVLSTQYLASLCPISKSIPRWHLKSSIKVVYFVTTKSSNHTLHHTSDWITVSSSQSPSLYALLIVSVHSWSNLHHSCLFSLHSPASGLPPRP
jgi:hypothetical protein